jgi:hypothetical protein
MQTSYRAAEALPEKLGKDLFQRFDACLGAGWRYPISEVALS